MSRRGLRGAGPPLNCIDCENPIGAGGTFVNLPLGNARITFGLCATCRARYGDARALDARFEAERARAAEQQKKP